MTEVDVIIEIAKGSHIKYEYDKDRNMLICDRVLHTPMKYPFNYGFIPNTLSEDGDPLDVVVLMDDELIPGCMIRCKILGYLDTKDDAGNDPKMIVCPIGKVDPLWNEINDLYVSNPENQYNIITSGLQTQKEWKFLTNVQRDLSIINNHLLRKIAYFFQHYKDLENKKVEVSYFYNKEEALKVYKDSLNRYKCNNIQKSKITDFFEEI